MEKDLTKSLVKPEQTGDKMETPELSPQQMIAHGMQLLALFGVQPESINKNLAEANQVMAEMLNPEFQPENERRVISFLVDKGSVYLVSNIYYLDKIQSDGIVTETGINISEFLTTLDFTKDIFQQIENRFKSFQNAALTLIKTEIDYLLNHYKISKTNAEFFAVVNDLNQSLAKTQIIFNSQQAAIDFFKQYHDKVIAIIPSMDHFLKIAFFVKKHPEYLNHE